MPLLKIGEAGVGMLPDMLTRRLLKTLTDRGRCMIMPFLPATGMPGDP